MVWFGKPRRDPFANAAVSARPEHLRHRRMKAAALTRQRKNNFTVDKWEVFIYNNGYQ
jgi:hypothetical protein